MIQSMVRYFFLWLFMLILPLQGAVGACHMQSVLADAGIAHLHDHEQGVSHHHDDHGHVQYDSSQASLDHVGDQLGCQLNAVLSSQTPFAQPLMPGHAPVAEQAGTRPDPFLDKPPRPPHASA